MAKWDSRNKMSLEEARELLRKELAPYWFGSKPVLAAVPAGGRVSIFPLDASFAESRWIVALMAPAQPSFEPVLSYLRELHRRYQPLGIGFICVLHSHYQALSQKDAVEHLIQSEGIRFPLVTDFNHDLRRGFGAEVLPTLYLFARGKKVLERKGAEYPRLDTEIQPFLRSEDPGLPLLPPYAPPASFPATAVSVELGSRLAGGKLPDFLALEGQWRTEEERVVTEDSKASIRFTVPAPRVSLIAQSLGRLATPAVVHVDVQGGPARASEAAKDLGFDGDGNSRLRVNATAYYQALAGLPPGTEVRLRFPEASGAPVAVYGLRFHD